MSAEHSRNSEVAVTVNEMDGEKNEEKPELDAGERRKLGIVKFDGFDDIDDDVEDDNVPATNPTHEKKRKRGGKKKNRRQKVITEINEYLRAENASSQQAPKNSRLLQELHNRERVHGMTRDETRQLLQDKLLFLGESALKTIRMRRFCLIVTSEESFDLGNGTKIPAEIVSVSMDNGKINSILRFFPTYTKTFEMDGVEEYEKCRMKRVYWNPSMVRDSNLMCRTWTHFLDRCLLNLLLVPVSSQRALLHFLRTMNEIRSVLNDRPTVSICLSRVVSCEDFVIAAQNVIAKIVSDPIPVQQPGQATLEFALELCRFHLQSMSKIFMSATLNGNSFLSGNKPNSMSAATSTVYGFRKNANALYRKSSSVPQPPQQEAPRFEQQNLNYSFLELIDETPPGYPKDSDKYQRIMRWITNITTETSDDVTSSETAKLQEEGGQNEIIEEENGEFVSVLSATGTRSENGEI